MQIVGRIAKEFPGQTPLERAVQYGYVTTSFFDGLSPIDRILIDHQVLNRIIQAQNEAHKRETKARQDMQAGIKQRLSVEELMRRQEEKLKN